MLVDLALFILGASLTAIPLYICNGLALVFGGKTPVDFGKNFFDGKPLLGKGKTFKGTFFGVFFAVLAAAGIWLVFPQSSGIIGASYILYGTLLALGAVAGDFAGSFLKRRLGVERGKSMFLVDQLDFVLGGYAFVLPVASPTALEIGFLCAFTLLAHVVGNKIAFVAKIKKVPW